MDIGIASLYTEYDSEGPSPIYYDSRGRIYSPTSHNEGFPKLLEGSIVGCAVDLKKRIAVFTHDGMIVGQSFDSIRIVNP
jgi:hypothetical protein